jgi:hypothetical protein
MSELHNNYAQHEMYKHLCTCSEEHQFTSDVHKVQCSVKYKQEETVEHQQTKELSREHKICCSNEVVLGCYDCFGYVTMMYQQHITV